MDEKTEAEIEVRYQELLKHDRPRRLTYADTLLPALSLPTLVALRFTNGHGLNHVEGANGHDKMVETLARIKYLDRLIIEKLGSRFQTGEPIWHETMFPDRVANAFTDLAMRLKIEQNSFYGACGDARSKVYLPGLLARAAKHGEVVYFDGESVFLRDPNHIEAGKPARKRTPTTKSRRRKDR